MASKSIKTAKKRIAALFLGLEVVLVFTIIHQLWLPVNLEWNLQTDQATCFQIYSLQEDYIVHGELAISRIDKNGNIKWQYSGCDIFVTLDGEEAFTLNPDQIALTDFNYAKYKVDFNGKTIAYQEHKILNRNELDNKKK